MFENPRRGRQARNFTTNVPKILDLKSSSEQIFFENWRWVPLTRDLPPDRYTAAYLYNSANRARSYFVFIYNNLLRRLFFSRNGHIDEQTLNHYRHHYQYYKSLSLLCPFLVDSGRMFGLVYSPWERVRTSHHGSKVSLFLLLTGTVLSLVSLLSPTMLFSE